MTENQLLGFHHFTQAVVSPALRAVARHWDQARGRKPMPTWSDLSPSALAPHFHLLWGFQYNAREGEFTGRLAGQHIKEWLGANFWGARLQDIHSAEVEKEARKLFNDIITLPAACRCSGKLFITGTQTIMGERIALPLASSDSAHSDGILGASDYSFVPVNGAVKLLFENVELYPLGH